MERLFYALTLIFFTYCPSILLLNEKNFVYLQSMNKDY